MCDPGPVTASPTPDRPLLLVPGGTRPDDVAALRSALAPLVAGALAEAGTSARPMAGTGTATATRTTTGTMPAVRSLSAVTAAPRPLLVPVAPGEDLDALRAALEAAGPLPEATDVVLRTSGSTSGHGSLVAMSAAALVASATATHERLGGPGRWVLALPAHHVAGLQVLVRSLVAGAEPVVVDSSDGFSTAALAEALETALERDPAARPYLSLVPTQLLRCLDDPRAASALSRFAAILLGGAAAPAGLLDRAREAGLRVVTTYGMSETGGGCVYDGRPLDGVAVRVEDRGADGAGRVVLSGPVLAEAVLGGSGATELRSGPLREVATGDRGRIGPDGRLEVLGRLDDVIVTGGVKVEPRLVESALLGIDGVAQACVVGVPDTEWGSAVVAAVVAAPDVVLEAEAIRAAVRELLDGAHAPKRVAVLAALPERGPGKVDRRAVAGILGGSRAAL